jgi:hypothetical protein
MKNRQDNILSGVLMAKTLLGSAGVCLLFELFLRFTTLGLTKKKEKRIKKKHTYKCIDGLGPTKIRPNNNSPSSVAGLKLGGDSPRIFGCAPL